MKITNKILPILSIGLVALPLFAQNSAVSPSQETQIDTFVKRVDLAGRVKASVRTTEGDYVTISKFKTSFVIRRANPSGQRKWERTLEFHVDQGTTISFINGIAQTTDGGFILVGEVAEGCDYLPFDCGPIGAALVKLRSDGTLAWKKSLTGPDGYFFTSVIPMPDGGFISIGGLRNFYGMPEKNELLIVRFTVSGDVLWKKSIKSPGGIPWENRSEELPLISSAATPDNGFVVAFQSATGVDVKKITSTGNVVWKNSLRVNGFIFQSVSVTATGGSILVGTPSNSNKLRILVLKADGTLNWKAEYSLHLPGSLISVSNPVQTLDGGYAITGRGHVNSGGIYDYAFIAKIDSSRNITFQNTIGQTYEDAPDEGESVFATGDGGFVVFGFSRGFAHESLYILKLNSEGIVPGCEPLYSQQFGASTNTPFGVLRIAAGNIRESNQLLLELFEFGLSSVVTKHPLSIICK